MVEYALKVADAIHFRYGVIHGEYMIDEKGPVLIEVNCRPMGLSMPAEYLDLLLGRHETDAALDSLMDHERFLRDAARPYRPLRKGYQKIIMIPEDIEAEDHPIWEVARQLRSTFKVEASDPSAVVSYRKTRDLESNGGVVYMVHDDEQVVNADLAVLKRIEQKYFKLLLNDGMSRRWFRDADVPAEDYQKLIRQYDCGGAVLVASDKPLEIEGAQCVTRENLSDAHRGFDHVIVGYQDTLLRLKESDCLRLFFDTMDLVREGGRVIIPQSTYRYLSYEREGAEELMLVKGLTIEAPAGSYADCVVGTRGA